MMPMAALQRILVFCLAIACTAAASASQRTAVESDQEILIRLEKSWNDAVYNKDVALIETLLADDFLSTYEDGTRGDKAAELKLTAEFNQQVESAIQDEFTVRTYQDTAVVRFTLHLVGIKQGQRAELTLAYTDVWVMRDGRWQCVSAHSTKVGSK